MIENRPKPGTQAGDEHESVLDAPEHIRGVAKRKETPPKKPKSECESVLDGKACIEGVEPHGRSK